MKRRKVNVAYPQETKWKGDKAKELVDAYKLYYMGKNNARDGLGVAVNTDFKENILGVKRGWFTNI